jgi:hypothetical protein
MRVESNASQAEQQRALPNDAVVIRGGESKVRDMRISARKHHRLHGEWALSGCASPGKDAQGIAHEAGAKVLPHPCMRETTAGALRDVVESVEFDRENDDPHVKIKFATDPTDADLVAVRSLLGPIQPNPVAQE